MWAPVDIPGKHCATASSYSTLSVLYRSSMTLLAEWLWYWMAIRPIFQGVAMTAIALFSVAFESFLSDCWIVAFNFLRRRAGGSGFGRRQLRPALPASLSNYRLRGARRTRNGGPVARHPCCSDRLRACTPADDSSLGLQTSPKAGATPTPFNGDDWNATGIWCLSISRGGCNAGLTSCGRVSNPSRRIF